MLQLTHRGKGGNKQDDADCQFFHGFPFDSGYPGAYIVDFVYETQSSSCS
jgi:hypothetical protein